MEMKRKENTLEEMDNVTNMHVELNECQAFILPRMYVDLMCVCMYVHLCMYLFVSMLMHIFIYVCMCIPPTPPHPPIVVYTVKHFP